MSFCLGSDRITAPGLAVVHAEVKVRSSVYSWLPAVTVTSSPWQAPQHLEDQHAVGHHSQNLNFHFIFQRKNFLFKKERESVMLL